VDKAFIAFWDAYPRRNGRRIGKAEALRTYRRAVTTREKAAKVLKALEHYASGCNGYPKDAHRWLAADRWREWLDPELVTHSGSPAKSTLPTAVDFARMAKELEERGL